MHTAKSCPGVLRYRIFALCNECSSVLLLAQAPRAVQGWSHIFIASESLQRPGQCQLTCNCLSEVERGEAAKRQVAAHTGSLFAGVRVVSQDKLKDLLLPICMQLLAHLVLFPNAISKIPRRLLCEISHANSNMFWAIARNHSRIRSAGSPYKHQTIFTSASNPQFGKKVNSPKSALILWQIISWFKLKQHKGLWTPTSCHPRVLSWH